MVIASGKVVGGRVDVSALAATQVRAAETWWQLNRP
jgi:hypothetical protein